MSLWAFTMTALAARIIAIPGNKSSAGAVQHARQQKTQNNTSVLHRSNRPLHSAHRLRQTSTHINATAEDSLPCCNPSLDGTLASGCPTSTPSLDPASTCQTSSTGPESSALSREMRRVSRAATSRFWCMLARRAAAWAMAARRDGAQEGASGPSQKSSSSARESGSSSQDRKCSPSTNPADARIPSCGVE